jgi:hypothetical protein
MAAALLVAGFALTGVSVSATMAWADTGPSAAPISQDKKDDGKKVDHRKHGKKPVACVNPAGHKPPGQQPKCKGAAHTQLFGDSKKGR